LGATNQRRRDDARHRPLDPAAPPRRVPTTTLSWFGFTLGFVASVAANVATAHPTPVGRFIAAWPPLALFIAYETLAADHGDLPDP
jgi:hypothetical protein